jgi:MFS family permease
MAFLFTPCAAVVSRRVPHRRGLALGITIGGSSIGGLVWPIMLERLLYTDSLSFGWTQRAVGFTMAPLLLIACLSVREADEETSNPPLQEHVQEHERGPAQDPTGKAARGPLPEEKSRSKRPVVVLFKNIAFVLLCLGLAFVYLGLFTPFFYISAYAVDKGTPSSTAFYLISAINASSFFGRVIPGHLADSYGHFNICILSVLISGVIGFTWTAAITLPGMIVWSIAYGFTSGVSSPEFYLRHFRDMKKLI